MWTSAEQYGTYTAKGTDGNTYTWNNDCWSPGAGPQTITVNTNDDWHVVSSQKWDERYWVETYPHIGWAGGLPLSQYEFIIGTAIEQGPGYSPELQWEAAYDIWLNGSTPGADSGYEIMIWTDTSNVSPSGYVKNVTIDGIEYKFYQAQGGNGPASWLVRTVNASSTHTDIKPVIEFVVAYGGNYVGPADPVVSTIEFGWEVWGTGSKPVTFTMSHFSLSFNPVVVNPPSPDPVIVSPFKAPAPLAVKEKGTTWRLDVDRTIRGYTGNYATKITGPNGYVLNHNSPEATFSIAVFNPGTYTITTGATGFANTVKTVRLS